MTDRQQAFYGGVCLVQRTKTRTNLRFLFQIVVCLLKVFINISLSEVELLLIKGHFSYARAVHGMFCPHKNTLRTSHISLASLKRSLLQYYNKALDLYDVDDIRT